MIWSKSTYVAASTLISLEAAIVCNFSNFFLLAFFCGFQSRLDLLLLTLVLPASLSVGKLTGYVIQLCLLEACKMDEEDFTVEI